MEINKALVPTKFLWVDLEMTGLDPQHDVILEIAAKITDANLNALATYEAIVRQPPAVVADRLAQNSWWNDYPENRAEFVRKTTDATPSEQVEQALIALLGEHFRDEPAILAGNSIHSDRKFIAQWWPRLDQQLHYRMLDVSSWKVYMQARYGVEFEKQGLHRAMGDIEASIAELQFYTAWFKAHSDVV